MVKKSLRYVRDTIGIMLTYKKSESLEIEGYSNTDLAGDVDDRKSTPGYRKSEEEDGGNIGLHILPAFDGAGELDDAWLDLRRALREGVVHRSPV